MGNHPYLDAWVHMLANTSNVALSAMQIAGSKITVWPNPARETLYVGGQHSGSALKLYQLNGTLVHNARSKGREAGLSLGHLPPGMYLLEVSNGKQRSMHRIMKL